MNTVTIRHEQPDTRLFALVAEYREWLETALGCAIHEAVMAEVELPLDRWVLGGLLPDVELWQETDAAAAFGGMVERLETPPGRFPLLRLSPEAANEQGADVRRPWKVRWSAAPVALWLRGLQRPYVLLPVELLDPSNERRRRTNFVLSRREDLGAFTGVLAEFVASRRKRKEIFVVNGPDLSFTPCAGWDHLVLDERVSRLVRDDFLRFLSSRAWFEAKGIPFRRGYLLYGPPGNGKTSVVRAMASMPGLSPCSLAWSRPNTDDDDLWALFRWAADHAPSLVIMEDLDRHFSHAPHAERLHRISLAHLLNCLDGLQTSEGVIVVATANNPKALDPAILNRPGRFDRVVEFPSPGEALRAEFFRKQLGGADSAEGLRRMVRRSAGFSFAQLRECYITAAYLAFDHNRDVTEADLIEAVEMFAGAVKRSGAEKLRKPVGFGEADAAA
jgi:hypothetical protein